MKFYIDSQFNFIFRTYRKAYPKNLLFYSLKRIFSEGKAKCSVTIQNELKYFNFK